MRAHKTTMVNNTFFIIITGKHWQYCRLEDQWRFRVFQVYGYFAKETGVNIGNELEKKKP